MKKKFIMIGLVIILIVGTVLPFTSYAATEQELNQQRKDIEEDIKEAQERQEQIKGEVSETQEEINKLNDEISQKEAEIATITAELNQLTDELDALTKQLDEAQEKYDEQFDSLCKRLAAQNKRGSVSYLDVLLGSNSLTDFISNYYMIEKIAEYDAELLSDIEENKNTIETSKKEVDAKKEVVAQKQSELKIEEISLTTKKTNKNKYLSQLGQEDQDLQKSIDEYNQKLKETDEELSRLARAQGNNGGGFVYTGGKLNWPVSGYRISSYFGYRGSAATGGVGTANHNGYDLACAHYTPIYAAEDGVVIKCITGCTHDYPKTYATRCYCGGGYGNYVMISHGNGLVTLYGHCSSINLNVGDTVTRGQKIGEVGSCGWSTGYHLHFSVILNGTYVNPGNYLG